MLAVQSFFQNMKGVRGDTRLIATQARLSCGFLKKHGYATALYTTNELKESVFRNSGYDDIVAVDPEETRSVIAGNFWSGTKLLACSKIKEPYIHVDLDLFLVENALADQIGNPFFALHVEPWMHFHFGQIDQKQMLEQFGVELAGQWVYNFGAFGGQDHANTNATIAGLLSELPAVKKKADKLISQMKTQGHWRESVFIEQFLLPVRIKNRAGIRANIPTVVDGSRARGFTCIFEQLKKKSIVHLWVGKESLENHIGLGVFLDMMERYYFGG